MPYISRRKVLAAGLAMAATTCTIGRTVAQVPQSPASVQPPNPPALASQADAQSLQERVFSAVLRIDKRSATSDDWGTGFLFSFNDTEDRKLVVLVTNKHVYSSAKDGSITINGLRDNGRPNYSDHRVVELGPLVSHWITHPDPSVDLAILPLVGNIVPKGVEQRINTAQLSEDLIPSQKILDTMNVVENVLVPGFPGAFWDDVNNVPIVRRGTTATAPYVDFQGHREMLLDAAIWPGSSGSPCLIMDDVYSNRQGDSVLGRRLYLMGIVRATAVWTQAGLVAATDAPLADKSQITGYSQTPVPDGIGIAIKSSCLLDFKEPLRSAKLLAI